MTWHAVASSDDVSTGKAHVVVVDDIQILLCRTENAVYAVEDVCSHDGGALDQGELLGERIECPRHGAQFDVTTGKNLTLPAVRPIRSFPAREQGGQIEVEV